MSMIRVRKSHQLGYHKACEVAEKFAARLQQQFDADYYWEDDALKFSAKGVEGQILIAADDVEVQVSLGLLYRPLRSRIEHKIVDQLDAILGNTSRSA
ncbi:MAG: polyhydroxyalkanoic acid system family protein [Gammaproteobacteria bacterium]|jgi:putative polyhydroxyalkanoate system protein